MSTIPPDIALITGPTMVGICLNWGFMGLLAAQIYYYHENFSKDRTPIKLLVYGLAILDVLQTALVTADAFHWFVFGFGNMDRLNDTFLNSWDVPLLDGVISLIVQGFYCWRIYFLAKNMVIPGLILAVSITQCVAGIGTAVQAHHLGKLSLISTEVVWQTTWLVGAAVADVAIAITLAWVLRKRSNSAIASTHSVITKIVRMTVETNALTASIAVLSLIIFWGIPQHSTLVVPPTAIIGKLYTNCLVAVFNNRAYDSSSRSGTSSSRSHGMLSLNLPGAQGRSGGRSNATGGSTAIGMDSMSKSADGVKVHVVSEMDMDDPERGFGFRHGE